MNPAEKYAALKLLEHALRSAITEAAKDAEDYAVSVRAKSLETDYGSERYVADHVAALVEASLPKAVRS